MPSLAPLFTMVVTDSSAAVQKDFSLSEWLSAFLEAELAGWDDYEPDDYEDHLDGGDGYYGDDIDSDILESLVILALSGALAFLLYYRAQRQRRQEEERQRLAAAQQGHGQAQGGEGGVPQQQQQQPGFQPDDMFWAGGGAGL
jgi:SEL1 protein